MPACGGSTPAAPSGAPSRPSAADTPAPRFASPTVDGYRVTVRPLVVIEPRSNPEYLFFDVHWRMNRNLPRERARARVKLGPLWAEYVIPEGLRTRNCYVASVPVRDGELPDAKPGSLVKLRIHPRHVRGVLKVEGLVMSSEQAAHLGERRVKCRARPDSPSTPDEHGRGA
jgi:hypothetical protein